MDTSAGSESLKLFINFLNIVSLLLHTFFECFVCRCWHTRQIAADWRCNTNRRGSQTSVLSVQSPKCQKLALHCFIWMNLPPVHRVHRELGLTEGQNSFQSRRHGYSHTSGLWWWLQGIMFTCSSPCRFPGTAGSCFRFSLKTNMLINYHHILVISVYSVIFYCNHFSAIQQYDVSLESCCRTEKKKERCGQLGSAPRRAPRRSVLMAVAAIMHKIGSLLVGLGSSRWFLNIFDGLVV